MRFQPIGRKDVERTLRKDKRKPKKFLVRYYNSRERCKRDIEYASLDQVQWKNGVERVTVQFEDGPWVHYDGEAYKCDKKRVRVKK